MHEITMSKKEVIEIINDLPEDKVLLVFSDKLWAYADPSMNGYVPDANNCNTLDVALTIEKKPGTVIYIRGLVIPNDKRGYYARNRSDTDNSTG